MGLRVLHRPVVHPVRFNASPRFGVTPASPVAAFPCLSVIPSHLRKSDIPTLTIEGLFRYLTAANKKMQPELTWTYIPPVSHTRPSPEYKTQFLWSDGTPIALSLQGRTDAQTNSLFLVLKIEDMSDVFHTAQVNQTPLPYPLPAGKLIWLATLERKQDLITQKLIWDFTTTTREDGQDETSVSLSDRQYQKIRTAFYDLIPTTAQKP